MANIKSLLVNRIVNIAWLSYYICYINVAVIKKQEKQYIYTSWG